MAKFYTMGCYTDKGLAGFINNPSTNRKAATQALVEAGGAKMMDYSLLRGAFDFIAVLEGTFEQMHNSIQKLNQLNPKTLIYCAHEYTQSNLKFVLSEIADEFIEDYLKKISACRLKGDISIPTTLELERKINPFLLDIIPSDLKSLSKLEQFTELRTRKDNA